MFLSRYGLVFNQSIEIKGTCYSGYMDAFSKIASKNTMLGAITQKLKSKDQNTLMLGGIASCDQYLARGRDQYLARQEKIKGFMQLTGYLLLLPAAALIDTVASIGIAFYLAINAEKIKPIPLGGFSAKSLALETIAIAVIGAISYGAYNYCHQSA